MLTPISFSSRIEDDFFIEPLFRHPDGRPPELCLLPKPFNPADAGKIRNEYRISANSFRGNYSLLNLALCTVTLHKSAETIQGRKLFKGGNYLRKYGK